MIQHIEAPSSLDPSKFSAFLKKIPANGIMIACSGGMDSMVLLDIFARLAMENNFPLRVLHVDHGLQPDSEKWGKFCQSRCEALALDCVVLKLQLDVEKGSSIEAVARDARYRCFSDQLGNRELLLTAHHIDDQAETFLLQALRGSGITGLSAMPVLTEFASGYHARPLLGLPRTALLEYAKREEIAWIDDPSNDESRYDRNFLRNQVLPLIFSRWPGARHTLARSARLCGDGHRVVADYCKQMLANNDLGSLETAKLSSLDRPQQGVMLRAWLQANDLPVPAEVKIRQVLDEVIPASEDAEPLVAWQGGQVRRFRDRLYCMTELPGRTDQSIEYSPLRSTDMLLGGQISWVESENGGVSHEFLRQPGWSLRFRQGGERIRPEGQARHRELKKLFQEKGVFPWLRNLLPLIYHDQELVAVADLWLETGLETAPGGPLYRPVWLNKPQLFRQ